MSNENLIILNMYLFANTLLYWNIHIIDKRPYKYIVTNFVKTLLILHNILIVSMSLFIMHLQSDPKGTKAVQV